MWRKEGRKRSEADHRKEQQQLLLHNLRHLVPTLVALPVLTDFNPRRPAFPVIRRAQTNLPASPTQTSEQWASRFEDGDRRHAGNGDDDFRLQHPNTLQPTTTGEEEEGGGRS